MARRTTSGSGRDAGTDDRPTAPRLLRELPRLDLSDIDHGDIRDAELFGSLPSGWDEPLMLDGVRLSGASLVGASIPGSRFVDVEIVGSDLSGADLERATFTRVAARDARLSGVQLAWAAWHDVDLVECRLDAANLARLTARRLRAERCSCPSLDLRMAQLTGAAWWDCDLSGVDVGQVTLERVQLHGSRLDGLHGAMSLRPVEVDGDQFHTLADAVMSELGVAVTARRDDDPVAGAVPR